MFLLLLLLKKISINNKLFETSTGALRAHMNIFNYKLIFIEMKKTYETPRSRVISFSQRFICPLDKIKMNSSMSWISLVFIEILNYRHYLLRRITSFNHLSLTRNKS
jgi:hypothetical protein